MIKVEKTTKTDLKAKALSVYEGKIVDDGEVVDLVELLLSIYGEAPFDLSVTRSVKEEVDTELAEEVDIEDLQPDEE